MKSRKHNGKRKSVKPTTLHFLFPKQSVGCDYVQRMKTRRNKHGGDENKTIKQHDCGFNPILVAKMEPSLDAATCPKSLQSAFSEANVKA